MVPLAARYQVKSAKTAFQIDRSRLIAATAGQFGVAFIQGYLIGNTVDLEIGTELVPKSQTSERLLVTFASSPSMIEKGAPMTAF